LLSAGTISSYAELTELGHVTTARISQITNMLSVAPGIQEAILYLPRTLQGHDSIHLRQLQPIAMTLEWRKQPRQSMPLESCRDELRNLIATSLLKIDAAVR